MDSRLSFLLLVLVISFVSTNARSLVTLDDFAQGDQDPNEGLRGSWELCSTGELFNVHLLLSDISSEMTCVKDFLV
ncbi:hypothetical protein BHE74_00012336 [Ensete ventricosum]|nr:hypothetical protein BHE74_00012336 [Ensete ventricosum]